MNTRWQPGQNTWLIKGDFDHIKAFNDVYGKEIVDNLLDWAIDLVVEMISDFQIEHRLSGIDITVAGDDVTVSIPPCLLNENCIGTLLCKIRDEVKYHFTNRFVVACLNDVDRILHQLPWPDVQQFKKRLESQDIFFDHIPRKKGSLVLTPLLTSREMLPQTLKRIVQTITRTFPVHPEREIDACFDWLFCPKTGKFETFNNGVVWPMNISFGAVSSEVLMKDVAWIGSQTFLDTQLETIFERMSARCQYNLQLAKTREYSISVNEESLSARNDLNIMIPDIDPHRSGIPLASERYLRQVVSQKMTNDNKGFLMKLEPVYVLETTELNIFDESKRGNEYGIGMKGVNTICGYEVASKVIIKLIFSLSDAIREFCRYKRLPEDIIHLAMFVDTFTIYFRNITLTRHEIVQLASNLLDRFNTHTQGIKLSYLTVSTVCNDQGIKGYTLLHQLDSTSIAKSSPNMLYQSDTVLAKAYRPGVEHERERIMERLAYQSACALCNNKLVISTLLIPESEAGY